MSRQESLASSTSALCASPGISALSSCPPNLSCTWYEVSVCARLCLRRRSSLIHVRTPDVRYLDIRFLHCVRSVVVFSFLSHHCCVNDCTSTLHLHLTFFNFASERGCLCHFVKATIRREDIGCWWSSDLLRTVDMPSSPAGMCRTGRKHYS